MKLCFQEINIHFSELNLTHIGVVGSDTQVVVSMFCRVYGHQYNIGNQEMLLR